MAVQSLVAWLLVPARQARQGNDYQRAGPDCGLTHWSFVVLHMLCMLCCATHAVYAVINKGAVGTVCALHAMHLEHTANNQHLSAAFTRRYGLHVSLT